ncbi:hypothetical protein MOA67_gp318 [Klebsiella phage KpLz-2_45]|uniref:hypothetical protein n=1 Tax=Klebsiella phage KpLz-2_45 TaxID=2698923 RepID=UPI001F12B92B|nr:hypothetical protein MOA67_gp318 [Klebsiella phage KpLz-2_45]UKS72105.1 hypothetical protein KpLz245_2390 [Klebsiella phage KpLz-2_45]DAX11218.1 MAG TPA: hypothetical protein [Bacteriophage sp.]
MATVHPSLNGHGYTKNPFVIADELFASSIWAKDSQSELYHGQIISLDMMIQRYSDDPNSLCTEMTEQYTTLFSTHFSDVKVLVTPEIDETKDTFGVIFKVRFTREGKSYDFSRIIEYYNGVIKNVLGVLNND